VCWQDCRLKPFGLSEPAHPRELSHAALPPLFYPNPARTTSAATAQGDPAAFQQAARLHGTNRATKRCQSCQQVTYTLTFSSRGYPERRGRELGGVSRG